MAEVTIHHPERGPVRVVLQTAELAPRVGETVTEWFRRFERARAKVWDTEDRALDELLALMTAVGYHLRATYGVEVGDHGRFQLLN